MPGSALDDTSDSVWWSSDSHLAGIPGEVQEQRPQGVAESTNKTSSAFIHVSSSIARQLQAAAPGASTNKAQAAAAVPGSVAAARPGAHVQFSNSVMDSNVPGEVPGTSAPTRAALLADTAAISGRSFGMLSGLSALQVPASPERTSRFTTAGTMRRLQSIRLPGKQWHLAALEQPHEVATLRLELTLQHSNTIEKVSAADLLPFAVGGAPFVNGGEPADAVIRDIRGAAELRRGAFYVPSDLTDSAASGNREVVSGVLSRCRRRERPVIVQLFVLFPSLMRPPRWLRKDFTLVKKAVVEVDWQLPRRTQGLLYVLRRLEAARDQSLTVWASKRRFGVGEAFTLYGAEGRAELTDRSYVLLFKFYERREGPGPKSGMNVSREGGLRNGAGSAGGEIDATPFLVTPGSAGGLPPDLLPSMVCSGAGGGAAARQGTFGKTGMRLDALHEVHQQLLLRAQSSDVSGQPLLPESGLITWDGVLEYTLAARDCVALRQLIDSHYLDHLLRSQDTVDRVEKVAFANNDPALMLLLYEHTSIEMDLRVLAFLVHCWAVQPLGGRSAAGAGGSHDLETTNEDVPDFFDGADPDSNIASKVEEFLVKYVLRRRNPLSATAAILRAIDDEMKQHEENRRTMRLASARFHSFHLALLRRLNRYADMRHIRLVERILQPAELPNTVNEVSPLQVAFDSKDLKFMTEALIELYVKVQWLGRELLALTAHEDPRSLGATNPLLAYSVLKATGFAGKGTMDPLAMVASRLWHKYVFTSNAFFNSPRGRWAMHALLELLFLGLYQWQVMNPRLDAQQLRVLHIVFMAFIVGNLLDMAQFVHYRYGSLARIRKFLTDPWNSLGLVVNGGLLVLTCLKLAQDFGGLSPYQSADAIHMCMATLAVFVWVRALGMAVPVYPSLGPLLNTVARMMEEVIAFLFPMLIVMTGFSTMMAAIYQDMIPVYGGFVRALLQLFSSMLGNFDFTAFQGDGITVAQQLYGIIALVIFLIISAILLMNLLIAIITNRYRPQEVEAESQFKKAQIVCYYHTQVTRNLVCSPFCLVQLLLQSLPLLPSGRRNKLSGSAAGVTALGLVPLDGAVLPDDGSDRPTGAAEVPHLMFLLTVYPIMALICTLLFALYTPFAVVQFASKMYMRAAKRYQRRMAARKRQERLRNRAHGAKTQRKDGGWRDGGKEGRVESPPPTRRRLSGAAADVETGVGPAPAAANTTTTTNNNNNNDTSSAPVVRSASAGPDSKQFLHLKKALQADAVGAEMGLLHATGYLLASSVLTVVGLVFYVTVLLMLVLVGWSGVYQWAAKVVFSLYNILVRPFVDVLRVRRRQQRVSPGPPPQPPQQQPSASAAAALHVASGVGTETATAGGGPGAVSIGGCGTGGAGALSTLLARGGKDAGVTEATRRGGNDGGGDESEQLQYKASKARVHWRHAILKVIAMKNERYLAKRDVLRALAASKFRPHMAVWNLRADLRSSRQDIMESQLQDLEDDNDPWDDDEQPPDDLDDDTLEATILERVENLTTLLKGNIAGQQAAFAALTDTVRQLAAEVLTLRAAGGGSGAAASAAAAETVTDNESINAGRGLYGGGGRATGSSPATAPRPPPPAPTCPPSGWGLGAELGGRESQGGLFADDSVLRGSAVREDLLLPRRLSDSVTQCGDTQPRLQAPGADGNGADSVEVRDDGKAGPSAASDPPATRLIVDPNPAHARPKTAPASPKARRSTGDRKAAPLPVPPPLLHAFTEEAPAAKTEAPDSAAVAAPAVSQSPRPALSPSLATAADRPEAGTPPHGPRGSGSSGSLSPAAAAATATRTTTTLEPMKAVRHQPPPPPPAAAAAGSPAERSPSPRAPREAPSAPAPQ